MISHLYGSTVIGVDISPVMVAKASRKADKLGLSDRVQFQTANLFDLPFPNGDFDLVIMESVLTPLPGDKGQALQELSRVLRPGGLLAINESVLSQDAPENLQRAMAEHPAVHGHFTFQALRELIQNQGFDINLQEEYSASEAPSSLKDIGFKNLIVFMVRDYPKIAWKLLTDKRFRKASQIDNEITKKGVAYMKYCLILCQKPF
jgi:ubiquinone/menaquinone biosynthesis C-methylase UbiE